MKKLICKLIGHKFSFHIENGFGISSCARCKASNSNQINKGKVLDKKYQDWLDNHSTGGQMLGDYEK